MKLSIKILIWSVGILVICLIQYFSSPESKFITNNEIVTWDGLHNMMYVFAVIWYCGRLTSKKRDPEDSIEDIENQVKEDGEQIHALKKIVNHNCKSIDGISEKFNKINESMAKMNLQIHDYENSLKILTSLHKQHVEDCEEQYECQMCGHMGGFENGICEKCHMPEYFERVKQSFHKSNKPSPLKKKTKRKSNRRAIKK